MNIPKIHTKKQDRKALYYSFYDSVQGFHDFVDHQTSQLNTHNRGVLKRMNERSVSKINTASTWYGSPVPKSVSELNEHTYFLGMSKLKTIEPKIKSKFEDYKKLLDNSVISKPKIAYNDRGLGIFSFDRAAMGLYRTQPSGSINSVQNTIHQLEIELDSNNKTTAVKSVYAYFKDKRSSYPALRLYLLVGGNATVEGDDLMYVGLACAVLVEFMEERGIAVEVNAILGTSFKSNLSMGVIRLKRFQDRLDKNQLLLMTCDPRYFRYRGFKSLIALSDYYGLEIPDSLGTIEANMGKHFAKNVLGPEDKYAVFENSYSINSAVKEVAKIIEEYSLKMNFK